MRFTSVWRSGITGFGADSDALAAIDACSTQVMNCGAKAEVPEVASGKTAYRARPTNPSIGLLAVAYAFRGMRPAR